MSDSDAIGLPSLLGQTIGNYQIEAVLGAGGMGQVFKARHLLLDRPVALKLMHAHMAQDPTFKSRFRREARAAAALRHPHIVEVFDFDEVGGYAYLVMELITGGTFRDLLNNGAAKDPNWSLARGLDLIRQAADALAYAHALGMVHRDIKPENLLLQQNPADGLVLKVADFGLARVADPEGSFATQSGTAMGTLAYMAPEQASGKDLDGRADIYALGIILYELVTGQLPFVVKTITEAVFKHTFIPPTPLRALRPETPAALEGLVLRCLAKQPAERFASAADLSAALRDVSGLVAPEMEAATASVIASGTQIGTVMQAEQRGSAPENRTLAGDTTLPRIQVLNENGTLLQVVAVRPGGISIGRLSANDLQLDSPSVSRHHLQITWDGTRVQATDLGSRSGTDLDGARLEAQTAIEWPWGTLLQVGPYWLRLDAPTGRERAVGEPDAHRTPARGAPPLPAMGELLPSGAYTSGVAASGAMSGALNFSRSFVTTGQIGVVVEPETLTLKPGQLETVEVTLANMSNAADQLSVSVSGVPKEWIQLPPAQQIGPWGQAIVHLKINAPESADVAAGDYPVEIRARSRSNPEQGGKVLGRWTVQPFVRAGVVITPARVESRGAAKYRVSVRNEGNSSARFRLSGRDDDGLRYRFEPEQLTIAAGASEHAMLVLEGDAPLLGGSRAGRFEVIAQAGSGAAATGVAQFVRLARVPGWGALAIALFALGGLGLAMTLAFISQRGSIGSVATPGTDLRTVVAGTATADASVRLVRELQIAGVLNQTSTAIARLPLAERAVAETAQAIAVQQTQASLEQQRGDAEAQAQQTAQAADQQAQQTQQLALQQTEAAAQATAIAGNLPTPTPLPTVTLLPATVAAGAPTNTSLPTALILPTSTANALLPTSTSNSTVATSTTTATPTGTLPATATRAPTPTNTPLPGAAVISFGAVPNVTFLGGNFTITATSNSNGVITYSAESGPCALVSASGGVFAATGAGTCVVRASVPAIGTFTAGTNTLNVPIGQGTPTVTFGAAPTPNFLSGNFTVNATTNPGGLTITYSQVSGPCTLVSAAAGTFSSTGAGTCVVRATSTATANLVSASTQQNVTIAQASQTIIFGTLANQNVGDPPFTITITGGASGNPITFIAGPAGVCAAGGTNGATISIVGAGSCIVTASQAGNANFSAAADVARSFSISATALNVTGVSPAQGPGAGGTSITITGTNFSIIPGATTITVGGVPATGVNCTITQCTATTGPRIGGVVDIVMSAGGQNDTLALAYQYNVGFDSINPASGAVAGGYTIVLTSNIGGFGPSMIVTIGGTNAPIVNGSCTADTRRCTVTVPPGIPGTTTIMVTVAGNNLILPFTYT